MKKLLLVLATYISLSTVSVSTICAQTATNSATATSSATSTASAKTNTSTTSALPTTLPVSGSNDVLVLSIAGMIFIIAGISSIYTRKELLSEVDEYIDSEIKSSTSEKL